MAPEDHHHLVLINEKWRGAAKLIITVLDLEKNLKESSSKKYTGNRLLRVSASLSLSNAQFTNVF